MAAKKPAKAQVAVTLRNLAAELAESHEVPKKRAEAMLSDMVGLIAKHLKKGNRLRLVGLGILQVRHRAARMGRNPATGEAIKIKASKKVAFRAAKDLKEAVCPCRAQKLIRQQLDKYGVTRRAQVSRRSFDMLAAGETSPRDMELLARMVKITIGL
jgi:DNA-binding protein HU-beta